MENPFESGHIKNYLLLYAGVVVIMILFFIASTLFNDIKTHEKKVFDTEVVTKSEIKVEEKKEDEELKNSSKFQLLDKERVY